jgi:hypothetical protein
MKRGEAPILGQVSIPHFLRVAAYSSVLQRMTVVKKARSCEKLGALYNGAVNTVVLKQEA